MKKKQLLNILICLSIGLTVTLGTCVFFQLSLHPTTIKSLLFFGFSSVILLLISLLTVQCRTCLPHLEKRLVYTGISLIIGALIIFFGWFGSSVLWHIIIGGSIIYLLLIELQLLGWTNNKQSIFVKIIFAIAFISNLFLASLFLFKIPIAFLKPLIFSASIFSILALFYGLYYYQPNLNIKKGE